MTTTTGPDFISLQVRDLEHSAAFYAARLGLTRAEVSPPHAVVFDTQPIPFAVREPLPGVDLEAFPRASGGVGVWIRVDDAQRLHDDLVAAGTAIAAAPLDGPFGRTFTFEDPDGYLITIHDRG
ncbi:VOC family protein [Agromyces aurantiacus]|uniref:VOC family protein n=1 Tax=Agromyces aurantiacus TaxID=165814 RepID=A0ABV9R1D9_9MICO|nr:VOC family protein [Agromyces aurantiacus]MBM7505949.1 putative enzyme related to lactoylglutathione lyase [Agromyces aurantiacus]